MLVIGRISVFRLRSLVGLVLLSEVSGSSFLAREVVEAARRNRHFKSGRCFDVASVVSALFTYKMNIFGGKYSIAVLMCCCSSRCQGAEVAVVVEVGAERFLSSAVVVVAANLDRRPWRGEDSSDSGATGTWNSTSVRDQECFARSTQIHSHSGREHVYTQRLLRSCVLSLWKLNVFNLQTSQTLQLRERYLKLLPQYFM